MIKRLLAGPLLAFIRRGPSVRRGAPYYATAVAAARQPALYRAPPQGLGVPDTLDGRFDMIGLHAILLIRALNRAGAPLLSQGVFDAMFMDMDRSLRELGVGDLSVAVRVKAMWEALHGRALAYGAALDAGDPPALAAAIGRNVWRGGQAPAGSAEALAGLAIRLEQQLAAQDLSLGPPRFAPVAVAAA
jgi:cytochrome b pre-mRNA-processing protein 3